MKLILKGMTRKSRQFIFRNSPGLVPLVGGVVPDPACYGWYVPVPNDKSALPLPGHLDAFFYGRVVVEEKFYEAVGRTVRQRKPGKFFHSRNE